jgi:hypothetical protein
MSLGASLKERSRLKREYPSQGKLGAAHKLVWRLLSDKPAAGSSLRFVRFPVRFVEQANVLSKFNVHQILVGGISDKSLTAFGTLELSGPHGIALVNSS